MSDSRQVKLSDVVEALDSPEEWECYLDRGTGDIITVTENEASYLDEAPELEDLPEWQRESVQRVRAALAAGDLIELPSKFDVHEWDVMRRFAEAQSGAARNDLLDAIHGTGAFRLFRTGLARLGIREDWYRFRAEALKTIARDWLEANDIRFVEE
jgi:hypothetical protein